MLVRALRHDSSSLRACVLPLGSICIDKHKPHCHYRQQHSTLTTRLSNSSDAIRPVDPAKVSSDVDMMATSRGSGASSMLSEISLKRCRLSPSPATGLVGMQENAFLNDYFGCLGFLPLASASVARQAMVNIMIGSKEQQRQDRVFTGAGSAARRKRRGDPQQVQGGGWGQTLAYQDQAGNSSKCIFWSAIALGALLQGRSLSFVTGYAKLAQDSLAECFDGTSVQTARAYLVMAFLCRFLGDQTKNEEYIAFASSIMNRLPNEGVPSDMENLLLVMQQESRMLSLSGRGSGAPVELKAKPADTNKTSAEKRMVHERDLCNIIFDADRRMHDEIIEDMESDGFLANNFERAREETSFGGVDRELERFEEQLDWATTSGAVEWAGGGVEAVLRPSLGANGGVRSQDGWVTPPIRATTMAFVGEVMPELERVSSVIERSGTCSGVGGMFYHSVMVYMNLIKGERMAAFQSIRVCARVMLDYPGICRFRPHMPHIVLLAAASTMCPVMYEPMREVYNSVTPGNGPPAPPLAEWTGMSCICNHVLCRSFEVTSNCVGFGPKNQGIPHERGTGLHTPPAPSLGRQFPPVPEGAHGSSICLACGAHTARSSASSTATGTVAAVLAPPRFVNEKRLPSPTHAQASWEDMVDVPAGGEVGTSSTAAVIPVACLEAQRLCDGEKSRGTGEVGVGRGLSAQELEPKSEMVQVGVLDGLLSSGGQGENKPETPNDPAVTRADPAVVPVSDGAWCDRGVGNVEVPDQVDHAAAENNLTWCGDLSLFDEEREGDGLCLTEDYLMEAAEALMSSPPLDEELGGSRPLNWFGNDLV